MMFLWTPKLNKKAERRQSKKSLLNTVVAYVFEVVICIIVLHLKQLVRPAVGMMWVRRGSTTACISSIMETK